MLRWALLLLVISHAHGQSTTLEPTTFDATPQPPQYPYAPPSPTPSPPSPTPSTSTTPTTSSDKVIPLCGFSEKGIVSCVTETCLVGTTLYTKRNKEQIELLIATGNYPFLLTTCTSGIDDMSNLFKDKITFNTAIGHWDTSKVTTMENMFYNATSFNQPIGNWNTSSVYHMQYMFEGALKFNQSIANWNTSKVFYMEYMFYNAASFNQDLTPWCVKKITMLPGYFANGSGMQDSLIPFFDRDCCVDKQIRFNDGQCAEDLSSSNYTGLDCSIHNDNSLLKNKQGRLLRKIPAVGFANVVSSGLFYLLQDVCTSGISDMKGLFTNSSIFKYDISAFDMKLVNVTTAFINAQWPQSLLNICLPKFNSTQYQQILDIGGIKDEQKWSFDHAKDRKCDCLRLQPCKNNGTCFDKKGDEPYKCVCTKNYAGTTCEEIKDGSKNRVVKIVFKNVNLPNSSTIKEDITFILSEFFLTHPSQISVSFSFLDQTINISALLFNRRRNIVPAPQTTITLEITTDQSLLSLLNATDTLKRELAIFSASTASIDDTTEKKGTPLALVIGLSVGGLFLVSSFIYFLNKH